MKNRLKILFNEDQDKGGKPPVDNSAPPVDEYLANLVKLGEAYGLQQPKAKEEPTSPPKEKEESKETPKVNQENLVLLSEEEVKKAMEEGDVKGLTDKFNSTLQSLQEVLKAKPAEAPAQPISPKMSDIEAMLKTGLATTIQETTFFTANPDLALFFNDNPGVKNVFNMLKDTKQKDDKLSTEEIYKQTGEEVRNLLGDRLDKYKTSFGSPALINSGSNFNRAGTPQHQSNNGDNSIANQIKDLNKRRGRS